MVGAPEIRRLSQRDLCDGFSSGDEALDRFFRCYAKQNEKRGITATSIAVVDDAIAGFVTIVPSGIDPTRLKGLVKGLSRQSACVLVLARMATDTRFLGKRIGSTLLRDVVFAGALELAAKFGCVGILVDAKPGAVAFYAKYGFVALTAEARPRQSDPSTAEGESAPAPPSTKPMFMALETVRAAMSSGESKQTDTALATAGSE